MAALFAQGPATNSRAAKKQVGRSRSARNARRKILGRARQKVVLINTDYRAGGLL